MFCFSNLVLFLLSLQRTYTLIVDARDWDNGTRGSKWNRERRCFDAQSVQREFAFDL